MSAPKEEKNRTLLPFKGYEWTWPIVRRSDEGLPLPHHTLVSSILTQEIRDHIRDDNREIKDLLRQQIALQEKTLAYLEQVFGGRG